MSSPVLDAKPVLVLIGPPAAGKSKIARIVAEQLNRNVLDTDKMVVAEHGEIPQIFEQYGEEQFRVWERQAVSEALEQDAVISLGGGAVLNADTQHELTKLPVVLLTVDPEVIATRIDNAKRPLIKNGISDWKKLVAERTPIYTRLAKLTCDTSDENLLEIAGEIVEWVQAGYPHRGVS